jgi:GNAT superfamily N-acetyltransferase
MTSKPSTAPGEIRLRDARDGEQPAIIELTLAAYQEYEAFLGENYHFYAESIETTLTDPKPAAQIVAEQDGRLVGAALLYPPGTAFEVAEGQPTPIWPEVRLVAVPPAARGRGIGKALLEECLRRARADGCPGLALHTTDMMQVALQMYERMGFFRTPEFDFYPAPEFQVKAYRFEFKD